MTAVAEATIRRRVVLIDLSSIYWSAWHATANQPLSEAAALTMNGIRRCYTDGDLVAICCDAGRSFRKDISPEYKANRPEKDQNALGELSRLKERLRADGFLLWEASFFEADDIIATAVRLSKPHEVLICSADKDLLQLVGPGVRVLRTHSWQEGGPDELKAKLGVTPEQMVDYLALVGDTSDNIKGAPGIGPKTAAELLTAHGSLDGIYRAIREGKRITTPARMSALIDNVAQVMLAHDLVKLRDDAPIVWDEIYAERRPQRLTASTTCPACELPEQDCSCTQEETMTEDDIPISAGPGRADVPASAETSKTQVVASGSPAILGAGHEVPQTKELTLVPGEVVDYSRALEPRSFGQALTCAKYLYDSRLYAKFQSPEAIAAVIMRGREMGLGAGTALDTFHVIEGRPSPYAYLIIARAKAHPDCEYMYCVEADETHATWETKNRRNPKPTRVTYTMEQARAAGLVKPNSAWVKYGEDQLVKSAGAKLARREYPDAALGLYAVEELGGD